MPNSLRCRIKKLCHQGIINEKDRDRIINGLDNMDTLYKINTITFKRFYPEELIVQENSSHLREVIVKDLAQDIAINLDNYIDYHTEFCPHINKYCFYGEIKVVSRK